jgi:hypothetical protein
MRSLRSKSIFVLVFGAFALIACSSSSGAPSGETCTSATVSGCNAQGFSCTNGAEPTDTNSSLVCGEGNAAGTGVADFCCISFIKSSGTSCNFDPSTICTTGTYGITCGGNDTPQAADPSLSCKTGATNDDNTAFCCTQGATSGTDAG